MRLTVAILTAAVLAGCSPAVELDAVTSDDPAAAELPGDPAGQSSRDETPEPAPASQPPAAAPEREAADDARSAGIPDDVQQAEISKHVDGDTLWVTPTGPGPLPTDAAHSIRILQIDTPETVHPTKPVGCGGPEASAFAAALLPVGTEVYLAADVEDTDRYGRFLRYVWTADGTFYNEAVVAAGLAEVVFYAPNDRYLEHLRTVETAAQQAGAGIWGELDCSTPAAPDGTETEAPATDTAGGGSGGAFRNCTEARDAGAAPVRVGDPGYGPHLDRDGDGVGCE